MLAPFAWTLPSPFVPDPTNATLLQPGLQENVVQVVWQQIQCPVKTLLPSLLQG